METVSRVKKRNELPGWKKLSLSFDIQRLREDLRDLEARAAWDGLNSEYRALCEAFDLLTPFFMEDDDAGHARDESEG